MTTAKDWAIKGTFYECCRIEDGHCALWFGRDLPDACTNLATYQIKEGQIQNVDVSGIVIMSHGDGIGPRRGDLTDEAAMYISDTATEAQRKVLETWAKDWRAQGRKKFLGVKFVNIEITEANGTYHITMPFGEQRMSLTVGGDGENPMMLRNPRLATLTNVRFCNTEFWKYQDYGKNLEFHNTSGAIADFAFEAD